MRIIAASVLALLATRAMAENLLMEDPAVKYSYTYETLKSLHFCDLATTIAKAPLVIKLTSAFITDDSKPKDQDLTVSYIVEAFVVRKQVKVIAGRIISDIFSSDLHAYKNVDRNLGASYNITSEGALALFTSLMMRGTYGLAVEFENSSSLTINVRPTEGILNADEKWTKCSIAIMQHQVPR
jgi:hypothetical protein